MKLGFSDIAKTGGRSFFRFVMKHYVKLKPLFRWMGPKTRSRLKAGILGPVFKILYASEPGAGQGADLKKGVNLIGYPRADIGEGEFLRQTAWSFLKADVEFGIYNYNLGIQLGQNDRRLISFIRPDNPYATNIFHLKPDQVEASIVALGQSFVEGRCNIGYWVWELSRFPEPWLGPLEFLDEIWCPSTFIQSAIAEKTSKPILYMPPAIDFLSPDEKYNREYFKLPQAPYLFLFVFDYKSRASRKNPLACVRAFKRAFPRGNEPVGLVIKSMDGDHYPEEFQQLVRESQGDSRVVLVDSLFSSEEVLGLMSVCDAFVSLHRSEGIGLCIAQSMLLGKPVIATHYSGNVDFTLPENSCTVEYQLIEVRDDEYPFGRGQVWADPNLDQAADYMRRLFEDESYRKRIAEAGQTHIRTHHSAQTVGKLYRSRLQELGLWKT